MENLKIKNVENMGNLKIKDVAKAMGKVKCL